MWLHTLSSTEGLRCYSTGQRIWCCLKPALLPLARFSNPVLAFPFFWGLHTITLLIDFVNSCHSASLSRLPHITVVCRSMLFKERLSLHLVRKENMVRSSFPSFYDSAYIFISCLVLVLIQSKIWNLILLTSDEILIAGKVILFQSFQMVKGYFLF